MSKKITAWVLALCLTAALAGCGGADGEAPGGGAVAAKADENGNYVVNGSFEDAELTGTVPAFLLRLRPGEFHRGPEAHRP